MTLQGGILLFLLGTALLWWVLTLVRRGRLYVGYGVILCVAVTAALAIIAVPFLLKAVTRATGALFPASALTMLALAFIVILLIYTLSQVSIVSDRLAALIQHLAIERAAAGAAPPEPKGPPADGADGDVL